MPTITPDPGSSRSKTQQVREMFDRISGHYDFLNHFQLAPVFLVIDSTL